MLLIRSFTFVEAMVSARDSWKRALVTLVGHDLPKVARCKYLDKFCSDWSEVGEMCVAYSSRLGGGMFNVRLAVENVPSARLDALNHIMHVVRLEKNLNSQPHFC